MDVPVRKSYGIICVNKINNKYEVLMVEKRYTYAFYLFVIGDYQRDNYEVLNSLLQKMTTSEKMLLLTGDFYRLWSTLWLRVDSKRYRRAATIFQETMTKNNDRFQRMIKISKIHGCPRWEIPKGKKLHPTVDETDIQAAVREMQEETGMHKKFYKILPKITYKDEYIDDGIKYETLYYAALAVTPYTPNIMQLFSAEIVNIKWMDLATVKMMDKSGGSNMYPILRHVINAIKKHKKKSE